MREKTFCLNQSQGADYEVAIPPGYRQTKIGILPTDWCIRTLGDEVSRLDAGVSVNSVDEEFFGYGDTDAILKTSSVSDGRFFPNEAKTISPRDRWRARLNPRRESLIVSRMNTPQLVGECGYVDEDYPFLFLPDRLWMTGLHSDSQANVRWLGYLLSHRPFKAKLQATATGTSGSMKNIPKNSFFGISIPFPQPTEQRAIAKALSDVDALLGSLDFLIAKKRAIKQAAMQRLLTGKTRLPGFGAGVKLVKTEVGHFPADWRVRPLLKALSLPTGQVDPRIEPYRPMTLIAPDHIESGTGRLIASITAADQGAISGKYLFERGDVVYSKIRPYLRKAILANFRGLCSADMYPLTPAADVSGGFMIAILLGHRFSSFAESVSVRSGIPKINRDELSQFFVALPPPPEQTAIAAVLSDMDAEIAALERRRDKTRAIKQGMMQQLLTGRIRLIEPEDVQTGADS